MAGRELHQALRSLCFNTDWNYSVFWKLKYRARMMLTWEDAYYDNFEQDDPSGSKCSNNMLGNLRGAHYSHDLLGLAMAKMSYNVYFLGEGIVGQVAVTGKHLWISGDSCPSFEHCDGWQTQFSPGIRTIAVVAVVPHGVVQLGSLNTIAEDLKLVNHIRDVFFELQSSVVGHISSLLPCSITCSPCLSDASTRSSESGDLRDCINNLDRTMEKNRTNIWSPMLQSIGKPDDFSYLVDLRRADPRKTFEMINNHQGPEYSVSGVGGSVGLLLPISEISDTEWQKRVHKKMVTDRKCEVGTRLGDVGVGSKESDNPSHDFVTKKANICNDTLAADNFVVGFSYSPSDLLDSAPCNDQNGVMCTPEPSTIQMLKDSEHNLDVQKEINNMDTLKTSFSFPAGCELYEALGPAFHKQHSYSDWETGTAEIDTVIKMPVEGMSSSNLLTRNSGSEHLLEAVVADTCHSGSDAIVAKSFCKSMPSLLTTERVVKPLSGDMHTSGSTCYSFERSSLVEEDTLHCLTSSEACVVGSSQGFSSRSRSRCSEQLERPQEPANINKKRARPGENCRPRPRDRQLIQDRIKELRELVPHGLKCSIDSLLERTIKHMLFLQCVTNHADTIDKCAESKLLDKGTNVQGSSGHEQGSSWAMEVGSHLEVCPIVVENISTNGQMLVEMMCEKCIDFLEIVEAIRNLGLTILKGVTEAYGDKTRISFVVKGQNNRSMHRMDILWSLLQILQSKTNDLRMAACQDCFKS